jgi:hypothetical protein
VRHGDEALGADGAGEDAVAQGGVGFVFEVGEEGADLGAVGFVVFVAEVRPGGGFDVFCYREDFVGDCIKDISSILGSQFTQNVRSEDMYAKPL